MGRSEQESKRRYRPAITPIRLLLGGLIAILAMCVIQVVISRNRNSQKMREAIVTLHEQITLGAHEKETESLVKASRPEDYSANRAVVRTPFEWGSHNWGLGMATTIDLALLSSLLPLVFSGPFSRTQ